jgi:flagellar biosynthesis/type III secretory pathway chaperone
MSHSITSSLQKRLVEQLVFIDENRYNFLNTYFSANTLERGKVDKFFETYAQEVEKSVSSLQKSNLKIGKDVNAPFEKDGAFFRFSYCNIFTTC